MNRAQRRAAKHAGHDMTITQLPSKQNIIDDLTAQGRAEELKHPNATPYWNGTRNDIRYVCEQCADSYLTADELENHMRTIHRPPIRWAAFTDKELEALMDAIRYLMIGDTAMSYEDAIPDHLLDEIEAERTLRKQSS